MFYSVFGPVRTARLLASSRLYSTSPVKKSLKELVAELRGLVDVSPIQAGQALKASDMDVSKAVSWLEKHQAESAVKKAAKVEGRTANEGLIGTTVLSKGATSKQRNVRAAMVELNCETDFVARNDLFAHLLQDIAHTAAFISEPANTETFMNPFSIEVLQNAPLLSHSNPQEGGKISVSDAMRDLTGKVGEKISLRRALTVVRDTLPQPLNDIALRVSARVHQSVSNPTQGRIGSLALLALRSPSLSESLALPKFQEEFEKLCGALGRQIIGFPTTSIRPFPGAEPETVLYQQPFNMFSGSGNDLAVKDFLEKWASERNIAVDGSGGVEVIEFAKWTVGEYV